MERRALLCEFPGNSAASTRIPEQVNPPAWVEAIRSKIDSWDETRNLLARRGIRWRLAAAFGMRHSFFIFIALLAALAFGCVSEPKPVAKKPAEFAGANQLLNTSGQNLANPVTLSTNWFLEVAAAFPTNFPKGRSWDYHMATNLLCQESQQGDDRAEGLWGFWLMTQGRSPGDKEAGLQLVKSSAGKGYVPAMMNLGRIYSAGHFVHKNYNDSFTWYRKAADQGDAGGQLKLGFCYQYGLGTTPDPAMAGKLYRLAAVQTNYLAMKCLGLLLMNGQGCDTNEVEAAYWLARSGKEGGNRRAMYNLGVLYSRKYPDTNSMSQAFQCFRQSAELGDALAALQLAKYYFYGWGAVETNRASYRYWRFKAAFLGSTEAQYAMGWAYRQGDGVPADPESVLLWYGKAAAKNHPGACHELALYYLQYRTNRPSLLRANAYLLRAAQLGDREAQVSYAMSCFRGDVEFNFELGKYWLAKAAENKWGNAEFCLYLAYFYGIPPEKNCPAYPRDKMEAIKWLRRAAAHGYIPAQGSLGTMLLLGKDLPEDKVEAEKLLRNAAIHGNAEAQNDLGWAIFRGKISSVDPLEAAQWCQLAANQFKDPVKLHTAWENTYKALLKLTPKQQTELDIRVKNFKKMPVPEPNPMIENWQSNPAYQQEDERVEN